MNRHNLTVVTLVFTLVLAGTAFGGMRVNAPVVIDDVTTKSFWGSFAGARNSANGTEFISCIDVRTVGQCVARDASGLTKSCVTTDPVHLELIRSLSDASWVRVGYAVDGTCTSITRAISSLYGPMK